ncbi:MAG: hypothetical protein HZB98_14570, partial [Bacteroidia bacterium]|nr:hypothetical protein [Bacteroidia bacterium]
MDSIDIPKGTVAVNTVLAEQLGIQEGEEIIVRFRDTDPIPENAPFTPEEDRENSKVLKVSRILGTGSAGNFSLGISQLLPRNIFMNLDELQNDNNHKSMANRLLIANPDNISERSIHNLLKEILTITDIGLSIRKSEVTGEKEIISDRIFIDSILVEKILNEIKNGYPVLTYLANSLKTENGETPYSFISGLPSEQVSVTGEDEIIISKWLADDLESGP